MLRAPVGENSVRVRILAISLIVYLLAVRPSLGQAPSFDGPVTIEEAVQEGLRHYPSIRAGMATIAAEESSVDLEKTAYLPETDLHYQVNRATANNVFGLMFPNNVIAPISGPATEDPIGTSTFGTAVGLTFRWEPFDFGLRKAKVDLAQRILEKAARNQEVTRYEVSIGAAEAFFGALAAGQAVTAAQANVDRLKVFEVTVAALVKADLRPGADTSRIQAELIRAQNELIAAEQLEREQQLQVGRWMGRPDMQVKITAGSLLTAPPSGLEPPPTASSHPAVEAQEARIGVIQARRESILKEYRPKFELLSSIYGRGTGALLEGTFEGGAHGLAPDTGNWAVGFGISFPILDYQQNQLRRQIESHREAAEEARLDELRERLKSEEARARVNLEAARQIAANTPKELASIRVLEQQAQARYRSGLGTVLEVADAERLLRQAETDNQLATLGIWKALFAVGAARGEMDDIVKAASR